MANAGVQLLGFVLALIGLIGIITATIMVEWKASSYTGDNIITAQAMYEGLWQSCVSQSTGQVQCKVYDSLLKLPANVQGTRGLMLSSIVLCIISILVAVIGMKCTTVMNEQPELKDKVALSGGVVLIIAGLLALVGTSWFGNNVAQEFYNPLTPTNSRYEFGRALYVGWAAATLVIIGGAFLCCHCSTQDSGPARRYPQSQAPGGKNYVYEFGRALYVGWAAATLVIIGGAFLCCHCSTQDSGPARRYPQSQAPGGKNYV